MIDLVDTNFADSQQKTLIQFKLETNNQTTMMIAEIILLVQLALFLTVVYIYYNKHNQPAQLTREANKQLIHKTIWITGASSGIGKSLAIQLSRIRNLQLIISARNIDELNNIAKQCQQSNNIKPIVLQLDMNELAISQSKTQEMVDNIVNQLRSENRVIDGIIHCAGVSIRGTVVNTSLDIDHNIMNTNYFGTIALTKSILKHMIQTDKTDKYISIISSVQGLIGNGNRSSYASSKFALHGYFESLRYELYNKYNNIHISVICPGYVNTNLSKNAYTADGSKHNKLDLTTASGLSPDNVALRSINAIASKQDYILIADLKSHIAVWLYQFAPNVLTKIMSKRADEENLT